MVDDAPDVFAFDGQVNVSDAERRERVNDGVDEAGSGADGSGFTDAFDAHGIHGCGGDGASQFHARNVGSARESVVGEFAADELALGIVDGFFEKNLSDGLDDAAVNLAIDEERIDDVAAVVDGDIFEELDFAGIAVDFDLADVRAERKSEIRRLEKCGGFEAGLNAWWKSFGDVGGGDDVVEGGGFFVGGGKDLVLGKRELRGIDFENVSGDFGHLLAEFFEAFVHGCAADGGGAAAECADAVRDLAGVAVNDEDIIGRDAEHVGGDLREAGLLSLAVRR